MTMDERVEAAARAICPVWWEDAFPCERTEFWTDDERHPLDNYPGQFREYRKRSLEQADAALRAAFPELFTDPPQAWIAPWEATEAMEMAVDDDDAPATVFDFMRDAHLNRRDGE